MILLVFIIIGVGFVIGMTLRGRKRALSIADHLMHGSIYFFLFVLGLLIGSDDDTLSHLDRIGLKSLLIALSAVLGSLVAAGILAAIMSSLDSQFLCMGTIFNNDIVTHYMGKDRVSDERQVLLTRLFIVGIVAVTYLLSLGNVRSVFAMGVWCFSGFSALFPIVVAALYWRGLSAAGAIAGVLAAIGSWCYLFYRGTQVPMDEGGLSKYVIHLEDSANF